MQHDVNLIIINNLTRLYEDSKIAEEVSVKIEFTDQS